MQIALYGLFSRWHPGPHEVWSLFNLTGTPPPDQMFAWHQAMYLDQHRHYPRDPFYGDMDLYDRPHLGGWITLFFFKLFRLPLTEHEFAYPAAALRFYHCFWWLLNNLYLFGVAPLFARLLGDLWDRVHCRRQLFFALQRWRMDEVLLRLPASPRALIVR